MSWSQRRGHALHRPGALEAQLTFFTQLTGPVDWDVNVPYHLSNIVHIYWDLWDLWSIYVPFFGPIFQKCWDRWPIEIVYLPIQNGDFP